MHRGNGPTVEFVEAAMIWRRARVVAVEMPLVYQTRSVACRADYRGDGSIFGQKICTMHNNCIATRIYLQSLDAAGIAEVVSDASASAVLACHQRTARWRTDATAGIGLRETGARACQPVDIWSLNIFVAIACKIAVAHVIGQDEDDVRALWRSILLLFVCGLCIDRLRHQRTRSQQQISKPI